MQHKSMLFVLGRVLIPSVFVGLGLQRLLVFAGVLSGQSVSAGSALFSAFELIAGLLIMFGWQVRWIAGIMALFILADAFLSHPFWSPPAAEQHNQLLHFLKNMSTLGGLILLASYEERKPASSKQVQ